MNEMGTTLRKQHSMHNHSQTATSTHYHRFRDLPYVPSATQSALQLVLFNQCHGTTTISYWLSSPLLPWQNLQTLITMGNSISIHWALHAIH